MIFKAIKACGVVFILGERRKTGALLYEICLNDLDFLLFSFSCEIRLPQCLLFGLPDTTFMSLTRSVSAKKVEAKWPFKKKN